MTYALDSNIISYLLKDNAVVYEQLDNALESNNRCVIPPVVFYEVKRGLLAVNSTTKAQDFEELCHAFGIARMSFKAWNIAAQLYAIHRKLGKSIEDADLSIAAFCIANGYTLVTNNTKHFENLQLVNWAEE